MQEQFDIIVLGTGPAASTIISKCADTRSVAVVETREPGGTCALRGCNPKKVLVRAAELVEWSGRAPYASINTDTQFSWEKLAEFKNSFVESIPQDTRQRYEELGVTLFEGPVAFESPDTLRANGMAITGKHIVIATGACPAPLEVPGAEHLQTSDDFLNLTRLPRRIVFVGAGFVSLEFAHVAARFGAHCTIIERGAQALGAFDAMLVRKLLNYTRSIGVDLRMETQLDGISRLDSGAYQVAFTTGNGDATDIEADLVVHGAGRVPAIDGLGLDRAQVGREEGGVTVNEYLQSVSNPRVYAVGDAAATNQPKLSPVATEEGRIVAKNLLEGNQNTVNYGAIPTVAYTVPGLASVGYTETQARELGLNFTLHEEDRSEWGSIRKVSAACAAFRVLVDKDSDKILGAHLLGPDAAETINLFVLAMNFGLTAKEVKSALFAFPSFSADVRKMV